MRIADLVNQARLVLPKYTDYFSKTQEISSIISNGGTAIISTSLPHGQEIGNAVTISNVAIKTPISGVIKDGLNFTFDVLSGHDLTFGYPGYENVKLGGFSDQSWNDVFKLVSAKSSTSMKIKSVNTLPILTGNEYLEEIRGSGVNGYFSVVNAGANTIEISGDIPDGDYIGGTVKTGVRISGAETLSRALEQYTNQNTDDLWLYIVPDIINASKSRRNNSDSIATISNGEDFRLRMVGGFTVIIVKNRTEDIAAIDSIDICAHDLFGPILKTFYGANFGTGTDGDQGFITIPKSGGVLDIDLSKVSYFYSFEVTFDLIQDDSVSKNDTRAFLSVDYNQEQGSDDTENMTANIKLN